MDNGRIREFLVYLQELEGELQADLLELQSGALFTQALDGKGERVDNTKTTADKVKGRLFNVRKIIEAYKAIQNADRT